MYVYIQLLEPFRVIIMPPQLLKELLFSYYMLFNRKICVIEYLSFHDKRLILAIYRSAQSIVCIDFLESGR